ncbi:FAD-dependent monooxygenase [Nocardia gipuzkoensis]|uniref:FAD-dependent monooxygenase n=1 Tax=Nocardia gipuzkoensis TaxID=2749991 RepID=UPI0015EE7339|nr:FAD-dependent monooxygenase [Nocardia gipuzkoensis]
MQQHLNGFRVGDPDVAPPNPERLAETELPDQVDVLIVGSGPAGLVLAAQLAKFPHIRTRVVERRKGPLELGQADGIACRSVEMLEAFGLSERVLRESCWITETAFWGPDPNSPDKVVRTGRIQDVEDGLSEFPHVVLNQARVQDLLLESMQRSASRLAPDYGLEVTGLSVAQSGEYPVTVRLRSARDGDAEAFLERTVNARYVVGCDGARSVVREQIGRHLQGDSANQAWGVMDVLAVTDFPDVRRKALIKSSAGTLMVIPREGGYLFRMYVEMDRLAPGERVRNRHIEPHDVIDAARRILHPYVLDVKEVAWSSVYEVGQRLTDKFDDVHADVADDDAADARSPRVFVAGDACHTHSPKAGQGMNVSMQDAFNLGWKLAAVLEGRSGPELLHTYSAERRAVAQELIDFDRHWAATMSAQADARANISGLTLQEQFARQGRYTAGVATKYSPGLLTGPDTWQGLATGFPIGARFHSAPVTRLADARPMHLGHVHEADGRWRLYAFADRLDVRHPDSRLRALCAALEEGEGSPVRRFTPTGADVDAVFDVRAVLQQDHTSLDPTDLPSLLLPAKGRYGLADYEKVFTPAAEDIFTMRGIDRDTGALVVVRPDQYVAHVLPLDGIDELTAYFAAFMA